jgi:hypothetical protein
MSHCGLVKKLLKHESKKSISIEIYGYIEKGNFSDEKRTLFQAIV